ncbi:unnamed protein product, partial [Ectocarpus sp. 12 AP-2014]
MLLSNVHETEHPALTLSTQLCAKFQHRPTCAPPATSLRHPNADLGWHKKMKPQAFDLYPPPLDETCVYVQLALYPTRSSCPWYTPQVGSRCTSRVCSRGRR